MSSKLDEICARKAEHVAAMKMQTPLADIKERIQDVHPPRGFIHSLSTRTEAGKPALIAEIKKASPSKGIIRDDFDPALLAKAYENGGASCLSVLTDEPYFQGHDTFLHQAKAACTLPVLRKDFMVDEYQIYESRALGADCILLIMAALTDSQARTFYDIAKTLGMDALIEVHDAQELERAASLNPAMIGVNSRNLKTLEVDTQTAFDLLPRIPNSSLKVAESGIANHDALNALHSAGYGAFLVGESLMRQADVTLATQALLNN